MRPSWDPIRARISLSLCSGSRLAGTIAQRKRPGVTATESRASAVAELRVACVDRAADALLADALAELDGLGRVVRERVVDAREHLHRRPAHELDAEVDDALVVH